MSSASIMSCPIRSYEAVVAACLKKNIAAPQREYGTHYITDDHGTKHKREGVCVQLGQGCQPIVFNFEKKTWSAAYQDLHYSQERKQVINQFLDQCLLEQVKQDAGMAGYMATEEYITADGTLVMELSN